jgi:hypothetical protein
MPLMSDTAGGRPPPADGGSSENEMAAPCACAAAKCPSSGEEVRLTSQNTLISFTNIDVPGSNVLPSMECGL